jgi:hypothetical protein
MTVTRPVNGKMIRFIRIQTMEYFLRKRWLLPILMALLIASSETNRLLMQRTISGYAYNLWDTLFSVFSNANYLLFIINNLFFFLVCDLTSETRYGQGLLEKLGFRTKWWVSKVILLAILVLLFTLINLGIVIGIASFTFPWQSSWSPGAQFSPVGSYLVTEILGTPPFIAFLKLLLLLILGWFGLGLFVLTFSSLTHRSFAGFISGVILNFSGLVIYKGSFSPLVVNLSFHQHMLLNLQYPNTIISHLDPFGFSLIYWFCWIIFFFSVGLFLAKRKDFFGREDSR